LKKLSCCSRLCCCSGYCCCRCCQRCWLCWPPAKTPRKLAETTATLGRVRLQLQHSSSSRSSKINNQFKTAYEGGNHPRGREGKTLFKPSFANWLPLPLQQALPPTQLTQQRAMNGASCILTNYAVDQDGHMSVHLSKGMLVERSRAYVAIV